MKLLLTKPFDDFSDEEFYQHAKSLMKPKVIKTRKIITHVDDNNPGPKPNTKTRRKTKKDVKAIEA